VTPPKGIEDVRYWDVQTGRNAPEIIPGQGRTPSLLADSIQPVVVLGDGKGGGSAQNEVASFGYVTGALMTGAPLVGVAYCEFSAPKEPPSSTFAVVLKGLAQFLDAAIPLPLFAATLDPATGNLRGDRVVIIDDVEFGADVISGGPNLVHIGIHSTTVGPFRTIVSPLTTVAGNPGAPPLSAASSLTLGHLAGGVPVTSGVAGAFESAGMSFTVVQDMPTIHPFAGLTPFLLQQNQIITFGQSAFTLGVGPGSSTNLIFNVRWRELPVT